MCGINISQPLNHLCRGLMVLCGVTTDKTIQANCVLLCWHSEDGHEYIVSIRLAAEIWSAAFVTQALSPLAVYLVGVGKMFPHLFFSAVISPLWVHFSSIKVFSFALNIHSAYSVLSGYYPKPLNAYALCVKPRKLIDMHTTMCIHSPAVFFFFLQGRIYLFYREISGCMYCMCLNTKCRINC